VPIEHVTSLEYLIYFIVLHCVLAAFCQLLLNEYCIVLYCIWHSQVLPWAKQPTLAGRPWACHVQTLCHGLQMFAWHGTAILVLCQQTRNIKGRRQLRSATRGDLDIPRCWLSTYGRWAFSCTGPAAWKSLPDRLKNSTLAIEQFRYLLKSVLF